jgi:hypothetical protein
MVAKHYRLTFENIKVSKWQGKKGQATPSLRGSRCSSPWRCSAMSRT